MKNYFRTDIKYTIHWVGRILEDIIGTETVERQPILISGRGVEHFFGVSKLVNGTGDNTEAALCILDWHNSNQVLGLCFETTSSNTGLYNT